MKFPDFKAWCLVLTGSEAITKPYSFFRKDQYNYAVPTIYPTSGQAKAYSKRIKKQWPFLSDSVLIMEMDVSVSNLYDVESGNLIKSATTNKVLGWCVVSLSTGEYLKGRKLGSFPQSYTTLKQASGMAKASRLPDLAVAELSMTITKREKIAMNSYDRKSLIRLASSLPKGSEDRRAILKGLSQKTASLPIEKEKKEIMSGILMALEDALGGRGEWVTNSDNTIEVIDWDLSGEKGVFKAMIYPEGADGPLDLEPYQVEMTLKIDIRRK